MQQAEEIVLHAEITDENLTILVHAFYDQIKEHPTLGPVFNPALAGRWDYHLERMIDFWSSVLLGSGRYSGHPVRAHFMVRGMEPEHFHDWLALFSETIAQQFTPEAGAQINEAALRMGKRMTQVLFQQQL